jgi:hypothetical protein
VAEKYPHRAPALPDGELHLCMADPQNFAKLDELRFALNCQLHPYVVTEVTMNYALERYYGIRREVRMRDVSGGVRELATPTPSPAYVERRNTQTLPVFGEASEVSVDGARRAGQRDDRGGRGQGHVPLLHRRLRRGADPQRGRSPPGGGARRQQTRGRELARRPASASATAASCTGCWPSPGPAPGRHQRSRPQAPVRGPELPDQQPRPHPGVRRQPALLPGAGPGQRRALPGQRFPGIKTFVAKASHGLRIVALRREITAA